MDEISRKILMICNRQVAGVWSAQLKSCWLHILCSIFENVQPVYDFYYGKCIWQQFCTHNLIENRDREEKNIKQQTEFEQRIFINLSLAIGRGESARANKSRGSYESRSVINSHSSNNNNSNVSCNCCPGTLQSLSSLSLSWVNTTIGCAELHVQV